MTHLSTHASLTSRFCAVGRLRRVRALTARMTARRCGEPTVRRDECGRRHTVVIALRADHYPGTDHEGGRAMDIGAVDGEVCRGSRFGACADLVHELAAVTGPTRSTELIYCWDPDGPLDPRGFARADHCDHIHWGMHA